MFWRLFYCYIFIQVHKSYIIFIYLNVITSVKALKQINPLIIKQKNYEKNYGTDVVFSFICWVLSN